MKPSSLCVDLVKEFESLRLEAYLCPAGIPTIGYGHTGSTKLGDVISQDQAETLLEYDLDRAARAIESAVQTPLSQGQFDALTSFAFNCKGWRDSTLVHLVNQRDFAGAASEFPKWCHVESKVLAGLVRRRAAEQKLFES